MHRIELDQSAMSATNPTIIKVVGVGGGGVNAINRMIDMGIKNVEMIAVNTDRQALSVALADTSLVIGEKITGGLGAGMDPVKGEASAREDAGKIEQALRGAHLVFITSGFGGGTGTGAAPVIAEIAKGMGALVVGIITKPFEMEGSLRMKIAEDGIKKMLSVVDSLILIPNENLFRILGDRTPYQEAIRAADDVLRQGVAGISDIITIPNTFVNIDFADIRTMIELSRGRAHMGIGSGKDDDRVKKAMDAALHNPLLDIDNIHGAKGILANIVCSKDFSIAEYREAAALLESYADSDARIKIGVTSDESLKEEIRVTVIATGFEATAAQKTSERIEEKGVREERRMIERPAAPDRERTAPSRDREAPARAKEYVLSDNTGPVAEAPADKPKIELPFTVVDDKDLEQHIRRGNLEDLDSLSDEDVEIPAFMRRQSVLKRS
ncbi:MAG: cell division protein FtsZ [Spirochaetota bacterium]